MSKLPLINKSYNCIHPYHLVSFSPWPILTSFGLLFLTFGSVGYLHHYLYGATCAFIGLTVVSLSVFFWFRDILTEGVYEGHHTLAVQRNLASGMVLFIASEVLFFAAFFWAFFHSALSPTIWIGATWPPVGILSPSPWGLALFNTLVLLLSGAAVTWSHYSLRVGDRFNSLLALLVTIALGITFTASQLYEYYEVTFQISDGIFGSCFFLATGFHGFHVIMGTVFLIVCALRHYFHQFTVEHHFGFEAAIWYWHFVDVVWLFLFISIYWWSYSSV